MTGIMLPKPRLIPRLDIKGTNLIKGIQLEGLRVVGDPQQFASRYYEQGCDELIYYDVVASLYGRNSLHDIIERTARNVFVPITVGGGLRSVEDVASVLRIGADKVSINTAAVRRKELITELARSFGSQCVVLEVQAKRDSALGWEVLTDNGRERSGVSVAKWVQEAVELGAGEILLTSVDREGTRKGYDYELLDQITRLVTVPVIVSGGFGSPQDAVIAVQQCKVNGIAMADYLHYARGNLSTIRAALKSANVEVRQQ